MVAFNYSSKEISCKIVYYGPGLGGKTTNLQIIHRRIPKTNRTEMVSLSTESDRTLFFDFLPLDLGKIKGYSTKFQLYTVPGQVYYNETRKLVLRGVDGIVFVADSKKDKLQETIESFQNLKDNLIQYQLDLKNIPMVLQLNKRDLPDALPVEELKRRLNEYDCPCIEAIAPRGIGVFESLKAIGKKVIDHYNTRNSPGTTGAVYKKKTAPAGASASPQSEKSASPVSPSGLVSEAPPPGVDMEIQKYILQKKGKLPSGPPAPPPRPVSSSEESSAPSEDRDTVKMQLVPGPIPFPEKPLASPVANRPVPDPDLSTISPEPDPFISDSFDDFQSIPPVAGRKPASSPAVPPSKDESPFLDVEPFSGIDAPGGIPDNNLKKGLPDDRSGNYKDGDDSLDLEFDPYGDR